MVNSQEWTFSRSIPELRLGVLGDARSGKSSLIHRFLTGSYQVLEKTESEQYKKEMLVDGQTHLVLIREEAGAPDAKVRHGGSGDSRLTRVSIGHRSIPWLARGPSEWYLE